MSTSMNVSTDFGRTSTIIPLLHLWSDSMLTILHFGNIPNELELRPVSISDADSARHLHTRVSDPIPLIPLHDYQLWVCCLHLLRQLPSVHHSGDDSIMDERLRPLTTTIQIKKEHLIPLPLPTPSGRYLETVIY